MKPSEPPRKAPPASSFEDQTKLEIGALSEVVLDRFVYDPNRSDSEVAVSIAKGIARFTTGVLRHESYKINTPTATIGVRGTILDLRSDERGTWVYVEDGSVTVTANGVTVVVNAGQATFVPIGGTPSTPVTRALASVRHDRDAGPAMGRIDTRNNHVPDAARHRHSGRDPEQLCQPKQQHMRLTELA